MSSREVDSIDEEHGVDLVGAVLVGLGTSHIMTDWGLAKGRIIYLA